MPAFFGELSAFFCRSSAAAFSAASLPAVAVCWAAFRRRRTAIGDGRVGHRARTLSQEGCRVVRSLPLYFGSQKVADGAWEVTDKARRGDGARARASLNFSQAKGDVVHTAILSYLGLIGNFARPKASGTGRKFGWQIEQHNRKLIESDPVREQDVHHESTTDLLLFAPKSGPSPPRGSGSVFVCGFHRAKKQTRLSFPSPLLL